MSNCAYQASPSLSLTPKSTAAGIALGRPFALADRSLFCLISPRQLAGGVIRGTDNHTPLVGKENQCDNATSFVVYI